MCQKRIEYCFEIISSENIVMASASTSSKTDGDRPRPPPTQSQFFRAEFDDEGVYFYQAYCDEIANHALRHGRLGGPSWGSIRMTWIKPSFAWMLYRSGYGHKPGQTRVLKIKLSHVAVAEILRRCTLAVSNRRRTAKSKSCDFDRAEEEPQKCSTSAERSSIQVRCHGPGSGRVQWDPERDLYAREGREPRRLLRDRAIQIGVAGAVSEFYVEQMLSVEEVTDLAHEIGEAHGHWAKKQKAESEVKEDVAILERRGLLPVEREYIPQCEADVLHRLGIGIHRTN